MAIYWPIFAKQEKESARLIRALNGLSAMQFIF